MHADLHALLDQISAIKTEGHAIVAGLTDQQLNWHRTEGSWSILDCLEHLNVGVTKTLPAFDRSIAAGRARGQLAKGPFHYGWFARLMVGSMEPPPKFRMRAPRLIRVAPAATRRSADIVPEFLRVRDQLADRVRRADGLDLAHVRVISPINRLLRMPLGGYFNFILAHDRRHLWQARNVRNALA
jgi:DinB family protein